MKNNIIFTGMPGSGKTTIGKRLAFELGINFSDFDDDILEKITLETAEEILGVLKLRTTGIKPEDIANNEVKNILDKLGDKNFLDLEGFIGEKLFFDEPTVLSTSGSLPLKLKAMNHLKKNGSVIYIDSNIETIISRLEIMKTDRIIGMGEKTIEEILKYREEFYNITKDYNFKTPEYTLINNTNGKEIQKQQKIVFEQFMNFFKENKIWNY